MTKILCPMHEEVTASCELYDEYFHCYGCGAHGPIESLGLEVKRERKPRYVEDLRKAREYIKTLPIKAVRGLEFPADERGFYICWPDCHYYKLRFFEPGDGPKYKNPAGHSQPPFWAKRTLDSPKILVVEGEINALSLSLAYQEADVVSPGSASDFTAKKTESLLTQICKYANIVIVVDKDSAGTAAAIHAKGFLLRLHPRVSIVLMSRDSNEILVNDGKQRLREEVEREVSRGL